MPASQLQQQLEALRNQLAQDPPLSEEDKTALVELMSEIDVQLAREIAEAPDADLIDGVNLVKKHKRETQNNSTRQNNAAGIITTEAPIHVSNVQLVVKVDGKDVVTRVGYERRPVTKRRPDGSTYETERSVRIARKTGKEI